MAIKTPQRHSFPETLKKKFLEITECSLPEWEISVPINHDLSWSIVLSFLLSTNYRAKDDFKKRLKKLTGTDENAKLVNKSIRCFNPFRNRYSCFYDEALKTIVNNFIKHVGWNKSLSISKKLLLASEALECQIILIQEGNTLKQYQNLKKTLKDNQNFVVLIPCLFTDSDNPLFSATTYNFLIHDAFGLRLKTASLKYYLRETNIPPKIIKRLISVVAKEDNFIKAVLNSKYKKSILDVYHSPYVVSKLLEAGYEMDPRAKDTDGFCGLYYALILKDPKILHKLYYFAVDNCCQGEASFRNPDPNIVSNLQYIEELLLENKSKLEDSDAKIKIEELLKLNKFLTELIKNILLIKNRINYYESISDTVFEASKRRDVLVSLLETYKSYFSFKDNSSFISLEDYSLHIDYYNSVDTIAAIMFFDNISFLKERLKLPDDKQYSNIESSFFFFITYNLSFGKLEFIESIKALTSFPFETICPLIYRYDNLDKLNNFNKILQGTAINEDNVVNYIPENEIHSILYSQPVIKNILEFARLVNYIKICKSIRIMDIKSVLVIERVLQVMGECLATAEKDDFSFKRFLSICLPKEISQILRRLRHVLTHLKGHAFPSKFQCETNTSLFRSILKEIQEIEKYFKPVYQIMKLSFHIHIISQFQLDIQRIKSSTYFYSQFFKQSQFFLTETTLLSVLRSQFLKKGRSSCHTLFKMALTSLEEDIKREYISSDISIDDLKQKIIYLLWPLKWLLELLKQCEMSSAATLLDSFIELEACAIDSLDTLKEKTDALIKECEEFLPKFNVIQEKNITKRLKTPEYIERFMKILKGFIYLSNEEKDEIRSEIPETIKKQVSLKDHLIESVEKNFNLSVDVHSVEFELTYLSKKKMNELKILYETKDSYALSILKTQDPIAELEEIFTKNEVHKKKYEKLCEVMQFSEKSKTKLGKLVAGQRKKVAVNNLDNLLQRIQLLKTIVIDEDEEVHKLWLKIKRQTSLQLIDEKIVRRYVKDAQFQAATEMLLFDCMILFEGVRLPENLWSKSSKLYQGINMRNILSHGNPLVENLCESLDPQELPSEIVQKILFLIRGENSVKAILELYERADNNYTKVLQIINSDEKDEHCELRDKIRNCNDWNNYVLLLPDTHRQNVKI